MYTTYSCTLLLHASSLGLHWLSIRPNIGATPTADIRPCCRLCRSGHDCPASGPCRVACRDSDQRRWPDGTHSGCGRRQDARAFSHLTESYSDEGGANWAIIASLIETCKLNAANPHTWLADTLTNLVNRWPATRIDNLCSGPTPRPQPDRSTWGGAALTLHLRMVVEETRLRLRASFATKDAGSRREPYRWHRP